MSRPKLITTLISDATSTVEASLFALRWWITLRPNLILRTVAIDYPGMSVSTEADCPALSAEDQGDIRILIGTKRGASILTHSESAAYHVRDETQIISNPLMEHS